MQEDTRNVTDEFKGLSHDAIVAELNRRGVMLEVAIENLERDFNMGTIVRSANAFGVRTIHVVGRRQWNKRGAMATDKYLQLEYFTLVDEFIDEMHRRGRTVVAIDNVADAKMLSQTALPQNAVLVFGAEGPGISPELLEKADHIVAIEQLGSTRSVNVGVAAGIVMYEWLRMYHLQDEKPVVK